MCPVMGTSPQRQAVAVAAPFAGACTRSQPGKRIAEWCAHVGGCCRDVGPNDGEHVFFFGHHSMKPKEKNELRRMDPEVDPVVGATYAIRLSDEDAVAWARLFDIAMVVEVLEPGRHNDYTIRHYRVQYFQCRGVKPNCDPGDEGFRSKEM